MEENTEDLGLLCYEDDLDSAADYSHMSEFLPVTEEESKWTPTTINYLLDECLTKKRDLHNPRHRRSKFFREISDRLIARGFFFQSKTLERKFHNLKKHFVLICHNRENGITSPDKPITWPYFQKMMGIFAEELEIDDAPTMASLYPDPPLPKKRAMLQLQEEVELNGEVDLETENEHEDDDSNNGEEESRWKHETVLAFLRECCRKKTELWDPNVRRRKIFIDIRHRLRAKGYNFFQESLDRKLRNMKKHFQVIVESAREIGTDGIKRRRHITWPYFNYLKELYGIEMEKEIKRKKGVWRKRLDSTSEPSSTYYPIAPKEGKHADEGPIAFQMSNNGNFPHKMEPLSDGDEEDETYDERPPRKLRKIERDESASDYSVEIARTVKARKKISKKKIVSLQIKEVRPDEVHKSTTYIGDRLQFSLDILALEKRRTIVAEEMHKELIASNDIWQKRLELKRSKLAYLTARVKRKKNGFTSKK